MALFYLYEGKNVLEDFRTASREEGSHGVNVKAHIEDISGGGVGEGKGVTKLDRKWVEMRTDGRKNGR